MAAYYNEIEPFAVAWLRELMKAGLIADGIVDERPIEQVEAADIKGFVQCHFFAGIGVWSHSLRAAGWPDDSPVWTGSCPCQSFSASGKRGGFSDKRHLWPAWFRLIAKCNPHVIFGEQVASKDGLAWLDVVSSDLEGAGYALGAADTCAAGFGAPHIRQRLYFVADAGWQQNEFSGNERQAEQGRDGKDDGIFGGSGSELCSRMADAERDGGRPDFARGQAQGRAADGRDSQIGQLEYSASDGHAQRASGTGAECERESPRPEEHRLSQAGDLGHAALNGRGEGRPEPAGQQGRPDAPQPSRHDILGDPEHAGHDSADAQPTEPRSNRQERGLSDGAGLTNGFWRDCEWLPCRDGKWRPVEPKIFPLASRSANRVGILRGAGNALCAPQAQGFIEAYSQAMQIAGRDPIVPQSETES